MTVDEMRLIYPGYSAKEREIERKALDAAAEVADKKNRPDGACDSRPALTPDPRRRVEGG
jgi:hypothetical protein